MARNSNRGSGKESLASRARDRAKNRDKGGSGWNKYLDFSKITEGLGDDEKKNVFVKIEENGKKRGTFHFDFLPYITTNNPEVPKGEPWWRRLIYVHKNIGPENATYLCPTTFNSHAACPMCEEYKKLRASAVTDTEKKEANKMRAKPKDLFNVIDLNDEAAGIKIFEMSPYCLSELLQTEAENLLPPGEWFGFLENGHSVTIRFIEKPLEKNSYAFAERVDFKERDDYEESTLNDVFDLDSLLISHTYDELSAALWGADGEGDNEPEQEPDEESPARSQRRSSQNQQESATETEQGSDENECPHKGGNFGTDYDEHETCLDCDVQTFCQSEKERMDKVAEENEPELETKPTRRSSKNKLADDKEPTNRATTKRTSRRAKR